MTKTVTVSEVPALPVSPAVVKPFSLSIGAPSYAAFQEAVYHARQGYTFGPGFVEMMPNGYTFFTMILGEVDQYAIDKAKETVQLSIDQEAREYRKAVETEAKRIVEQEKRDLLTQQVALEVAAHEQKIKELQREAAGQIAALERAAAQAMSQLK